MAFTRTGRRIKEHIMYVERETGGFARGTIIAGDGEKVLGCRGSQNGVGLCFQALGGTGGSEP
jgi:hypothetical protein